MKACTMWFMGAPDAVKTALARRVEGALLERGVPVEIVDGGELGANLRIGLGASADDEATYARRIGCLCRMLSRNSIVTIATGVAPRKSLRDEARASIERFVEVRIARPGAAEEAGASGSDGPGRPEIIVTEDPAAEEESAERVLSTLEALGYLAPAAGRGYSVTEEEEIKSRLRELGYI
jgi:hypothetical protein